MTGPDAVGYVLWINRERTVLVRWWRQLEQMEVCTREHPDAIWGPPVQLDLDAHQ